MTDPNSRQIGGDHYQSSYQHWDLMEDYGMGYLESAITKYVTRWKKKNGAQDVEKAIHYLDKLIEKAGTKQRKHRGIVPMGEMVRYVAANNLGVIEAEIHMIICGDWNVSKLNEARVLIVKLHEMALAHAQTSPATVFANASRASTQPPG